MSNLKLTIDLVPKGAWGNNLRTLLSQKDWDTLRNIAYAKAKHRCAICGASGELEAHEVWDFDVKSKTQTLKDIIALCPACHGVKHFRNSTRIGYGESAKAHFLKINKCNSMTFAKHFSDATFLFEQRNKVLRWKLNVNLDRFGGEGMEVAERKIPFIENPYVDIDWTNANHIKASKLGLDAKHLVLLLSDEEVYSGEIKKAVGYYAEDNFEKNTEIVFKNCPFPPEINLIEVNNYEGTVTVVSSYANRIEWIRGNEIIKKKYNFGGKFITKLSVEDFEDSLINFRLVGSYGETYSQTFRIYNAS